MNGKSVLVVGGAAVGATLARGLGKLGAKVTQADSVTGPADVVVVPMVDPGGLKPANLMDMDDAEWTRRCEAPMAWLRHVMMDVHAHLADRGGQVILLIPTIAMVGAPGFTAYSAVGEGARSLAKAVARSWGKKGIVVNCLALTQEQMAPDSDETVTQLRTPAPLKTPALETDVAAFIAAWTSAPPVTTGGVVMLDGGVYMPA
jgi:NAD(P)-dependent dehydrogenase (short-subunit alcohol dehydrogenase family)